MGKAGGHLDTRRLETWPGSRTTGVHSGELHLGYDTADTTDPRGKTWTIFTANEHKH